MPFLSRFLLLLLSLSPCLCVNGEGEKMELPALVVLANANDINSLNVARDYLRKRNLPTSRMIALPMPGQETISRDIFHKSIWNPLIQELDDLGWFDAFVSEDLEVDGRVRWLLNANRLKYLVLCHGVPLRISQEKAEDPGAEDQSMASVDSELAALPMGNIQKKGPIANPLFNNRRPSIIQEQSILRVTRLDGPDVRAARMLVDRAIEGEKVGLVGRAYIDTGGPHQQGDAWLELARQELAGAGYPVEIKEGKGRFKATDRLDQAIWYLGWYTRHADGPFSQPDFMFPPGAIALHIHSFSADTLRHPAKGWVAPLVERGITATFGNVYEPFLQLSQQPALLVEAILEGRNLADAAYFSQPALSWQGIIVGDPLYQPLLPSAVLKEDERDPLSPGSVEITLMYRPEESTSERLKRLKRRMDEFPSPAIALEVATLQLQEGAPTKAQRTLGFLPHIRNIRFSEGGLYLRAIQLLAEAGDIATAARAMENLLRQPWAEQAPIRMPLLQAAITLTDKVVPEQAARWTAEKTRLQASQQVAKP